MGLIAKEQPEAAEVLKALTEKGKAPDVEIGCCHVEGLAGVLGENVVEDAGHAVGLVVYDVGDEHRAQTAVSTWRV